MSCWPRMLRRVRIGGHDRLLQRRRLAVLPQQRTEAAGIVEQRIAGMAAEAPCPRIDPLRSLPAKRIDGSDTGIAVMASAFEAELEGRSERQVAVPDHAQVQVFA